VGNLVNAILPISYKNINFFKWSQNWDGPYTIANFFKEGVYHLVFFINL
jgi:hypothetical protein